MNNNLLVMLKQSFLVLTIIAFFISSGCSSNSNNSAPAEFPQKNSYESSFQEEAQAENLPLQSSEEVIPEGEEAASFEGDELDEEDDDFGDEFDEFEEEFGDADASEMSDPLEGYNRAMTVFNDRLYFWVLKPVASGYRWAVPEGARRGINRFFTNLMYPVRAVNNLLQGKVKNTGEETLRFVTNSTIGLFGFFDPARDWFGLEPHDEDFGQTLGKWGVGAGPHIVLPFFGPRNLRDALSMYPDSKYLDPKTNYVEGIENQVAVFAFDTVNETSLRIGEYESLKADAVDFYKFLRDSYEQMRIREIEE